MGVNFIPEGHGDPVHPDSCPALVLNADFRPLSYLSIKSLELANSAQGCFPGTGYYSQ